MLHKLHKDFRVMDEHFQQQKAEAKVFAETLEPILK
jgi:hypothetical protein